MSTRRSRSREAPVAAMAGSRSVAQRWRTTTPGRAWAPSGRGSSGSSAKSRWCGSQPSPATRFGRWEVCGSQPTRRSRTRSFASTRRCAKTASMPVVLDGLSRAARSSLRGRGLQSDRRRDRPRAVGAAAGSTGRRRRCRDRRAQPGRSAHARRPDDRDRRRRLDWSSCARARAPRPPGSRPDARHRAAARAALRATSLRTARVRLLAAAPGRPARGRWQARRELRDRAHRRRGNDAASAAAASRVSSQT